MKRKVGILGGTFDPPHFGHLVIANEVLHQLELDHVKFMPNNVPPHKENVSGTTSSDRLRMLELAVEGNDRFLIEPIELEREGRSYTFETMKMLTERNPEQEYYFIIGADMVEYLPKWHKIDELVGLVRFVGVNRPHFKTKSLYPIIRAEVPMIELSSTMIRDRVKTGRTIKYWLPEPVEDYIKENGLYGSQNSS